MTAYFERRKAVIQAITAIRFYGASFLRYNKPSDYEWVVFTTKDNKHHTLTWREALQSEYLGVRIQTVWQLERAKNIEGLKLALNNEHEIVREEAQMMLRSLEYQALRDASSRKDNEE